MRRLLVVFGFALPALILIGWLVAAQLPRWTAPQPNWFVPSTPGVCAAVESLVLYGATRADVGGIGRETAVLDATQVVTAHYDVGASALPGSRSEPLGVEATLPGDPPRAYYVITMALSDDPLRKVALIYLDAATGEARALITTLDDPSANCGFNVKAALLAAAKSPPLILLIAYAALVVAALAGWWLFKGRLKRRKTH